MVLSRHCRKIRTVNGVDMASSSTLAKTAILVDAGAGICGLGQHSGRFVGSLRSAAQHAEEVDLVLVTHLILITSAASRPQDRKAGLSNSNVYVRQGA